MVVCVVNMTAFWDTIRPLADARLVLALAMVIAASILSWNNHLDGQLWLAAVGGVVWWSGNRATGNTGVSAELRSRQL